MGETRVRVKFKHTYDNPADYNLRGWATPDPNAEDSYTVEWSDGEADPSHIRWHFNAGDTFDLEETTA